MLLFLKVVLFAGAGVFAAPFVVEGLSAYRLRNTPDPDNGALRKIDHGVWDGRARWAGAALGAGLGLLL